MSYKLRRRAQGRLFTVPGGTELRELAEALRQKTDALHNPEVFELPQKEWSLALDDQAAAVQDFNERVAELVSERSKVRLGRGHWTPVRIHLGKR